MTMRPMMRWLGMTVGVMSMSGVAVAAPLTFDFKDPKGVNNVIFQLDALLEAINGSANGVSGTITFDPTNPAATRGKVIVATPSLHVDNPVMKEHLHGGQWMDVAKHPEITFELKELKKIKSQDNKTEAEAVGTFTMKGVSREITVPVTLTYLKDKLSLRVPNQQGDLLVIRSDFRVRRSDYGINPGAPQDKVADEIQLKLSIAGAAPR